MLTVVTFKWNTPAYRTTFLPEHVNILQSMVSRNLDVPHRFLCITDDATGLECDSFPLWDFPELDLKPEKTNAYRCLKLFAPDMSNVLDTERVLVLDLDIVIVSNITPLVNNNFEFAAWSDPSKNTHYNSSIWLHTLETRTQVWETFDPIESPKLLKQTKIIGSDQAWMSCILGGGEKKWKKNDGIYSFRKDLKRKKKSLPKNARVVIFHGKHNPWDEDVIEKFTWVKEHYK